MWGEDWLDCLGTMAVETQKGGKWGKGGTSWSAWLHHTPRGSCAGLAWVTVLENFPDPVGG